MNEESYMAEIDRLHILLKEEILYSKKLKEKIKELEAKVNSGTQVNNSVNNNS